ncbi:hypothetical protein LTR85_002782 [Meristemomyces frigidus]|nr:hypothetical protein LTR85_002782 [Meristemomyces frigidus]
MAAPPLELQSQMWENITKRLKKDGIPTEQLDIRKFLFCLPDSGVSYSKDQREVFRDLLRAPMQVSTQRIAKVFNLRLFTADTKPPPPGKWVHYIRTFTLQVADLKDILKNELVRDTDHAHIRYAGRSQSKSAWQRFTDDLSRGGFYGEWIRMWSADPTDPAWTSSRGWAAHEFEDATGDPVTISGAFAGELDAQEQVIIAVFDRNALLNQRPGGSDVNFRPTERLNNLMLQLNIKGFQSILTHATQPTAQEMAAVLASLRPVQAFVNQTSDHRKKLGMRKGAVNFPFGNTKLDAYAAQANASTILPGQTAFLIMGAEPSYHEFTLGQPTWTAGTRSTEFLLLMLGQIWGLEGASTTSSKRRADVMNLLVARSHVPFNDLKKWPENVEWAQAMNQTLNYLNVIKPFIVLSLGQAPSLACVRDFVAFSDDAKFTNDAHGILKRAGNLTVQNFHRAQTTGAAGPAAVAPDDTYFICIQSIHPGLAAQMQNSEPGLRLLWLTLAKTDLAIDILISKLAQVNFAPVSRRRLCEEVIKEVDDRWIAAHGDDLMEEAKFDISEVRGGIVYEANLHGKAPRFTTINRDGSTADVCLFDWRDPTGQRKTVELVLAAPAHKRNSRIPGERYVFFSKDGIDFRTGSSAGSLAMGVTVYEEASPGDPTVPGEVLRDRYDRSRKDSRDVIMLWEQETGLDFEQLFPSTDTTDLGWTQCMECRLYNQLCVRGSIYVRCNFCRLRGCKCSAFDHDITKTRSHAADTAHPDQFKKLSDQKQSLKSSTKTGKQPTLERLKTGEPSPKKRFIRYPSADEKPYEPGVLQEEAAHFQCSPCFQGGAKCAFVIGASICTRCSRKGFNCIPMTPEDLLSGIAKLNGAKARLVGGQQQQALQRYGFSQAGLASAAPTTPTGRSSMLVGAHTVAAPQQRGDDTLMTIDPTRHSAPQASRGDNTPEDPCGTCKLLHRKCTLNSSTAINQGKCDPCLDEGLQCIWQMPWEDAAPVATNNPYAPPPSNQQQMQQLGASSAFMNPRMRRRNRSPSPGSRGSPLRPSQERPYGSSFSYMPSSPSHTRVASSPAHIATPQPRPSSGSFLPPQQMGRIFDMPPSNQQQAYQQPQDRMGASSGLGQYMTAAPDPSAYQPQGFQSSGAPSQHGQPQGSQAPAAPYGSTSNPSPYGYGSVSHPSPYVYGSVDHPSPYAQGPPAQTAPAPYDYGFQPQPPAQTAPAPYDYGFQRQPPSQTAPAPYDYGFQRQPPSQTAPAPYLSQPPPQPPPQPQRDLFGRAVMQQTTIRNLDGSLRVLCSACRANGAQANCHNCVVYPSG